MRIRDLLGMVLKMVVVGIVSIMCFSEAFAYEDGDFQYWNVNEIVWEAKKDWKISLEEELRWGGGGSELYYQHSDVGLIYSGIADWLDVKAAYRQIFNKGKKSWTYENVPKLDVTLKAEAFGFKLVDRSRLEFRNFENKKDNWRYRNCAKVKAPVTLGKVKFAPYVADETFFDLSRHCDFSRNRLYSGLEIFMFGGFTMDVYYVLQTTKSGAKWIDYNVLGSKIKLAF